MKTDKELLELAEKAARSVNKDILTIGCPLTDDGDALRLAVSLDMSITHFTMCVEVRPFYEGMSGCCASEPVSGDRLAATRRAIVRAAASIGGRL